MVAGGLAAWSQSRRSRAWATGWSLPTRTRVSSRLRPPRSTWWSAAWRLATSGEPTGGQRRCARWCGSCGPAAGCASSMTARTATPPCCGTPAALTWPCGSWTGGPGWHGAVISVRDARELLAGVLQLAGPLAGPAEGAGGLAAHIRGRSTAGEVDVLAPVHPPRVGATGVAREMPGQLPEEPVHDLGLSAVPP